MRKTLLAIALCSSASLSAYDCCCLNNTISFFFEYSYLHRTEIRGRTLVEDTTNFQVIEDRIKGDKVITTKGLTDRLGWENVYKGGVTLFINECGSVEGFYQYISPYSASKTVLSEGELSFPFKNTVFAPGFIDADQATAKYESRLSSAEVNFWRHITPRRVDYFSFSWIFGIRYIYLKEEFDLAMTKESILSTYTIDTKNTLYGGQIGMNFDWNPTACWTWSLRAKVGGFYNDGRNKALLIDSNETLLSFKKENKTGTYLLEGYGQLAYHPNRFFDVYVGYQAYLLTGLLLAPEQVDKKANTLREYSTDDGQIVIDGVYVGASFSF